MLLKKLILVVDDELFFRKVLREALQDDYDIIEARNGDEAIELAISNSPKLIIMDVEMPVRNGIEACKILKENQETRKIPIVLFTSLSKNEDLVVGLKAGADDYITKPMCLPEVIARVDAHLRTVDYYSDLEHEDLMFLLELTEHISAIRNPMTILRLIVDKMSEIIDVSRCSIVSINNSGEAYVKASSDLKYNEEIKIDLVKYPEINQSFELKKSIIINDIKNDPIMTPVRAYVKDLEYNSIVVIPVIKKESVIGTFFLRTASTLKDGITERIYKLCHLVANISANALENAILFESMKTAQEYFEEMAIRDGLTKLYNHRHFYSRLDEEFSRASRYNLPLSLIVFDIDNFKQINDTYGHTSGDKVLQQIGQLMKKVARESDIPARYGGEEFAVILPNTPSAGGQEVAARLCSIIRDHTFEQLEEVTITISVGSTTLFNGNLDSPAEMVALADKAMYTSKQMGKNRSSHAG